MKSALYLLSVCLCLSSAANARTLTEGLSALRRHHRSEPATTLNLRPLIGIVSQSGSPARKGQSYIAASYVKFVESAGARVVPILHDTPKHHLERIFDTINGVLLPGGSQNLEPGNPYFDTSSHLYDLAKKANDNGDYFPIWGTCLGFETLMILSSGGNASILAAFDAENFAASLKPTRAFNKSPFLKALPTSVVDDLKKYPYAMENHEHGIAPAAWNENPLLAEEMEILTVSLDRKGKEYVSTVEGKKHPFIGTQWHPEKNSFEWTQDLNIPHQPGAIAVTQAVGNFFVAQARMNEHQALSLKEEEELLIYNYKPKYTGKHSYEGEEVAFEQTFVFPAYEEHSALERAEEVILAEM